MPRLTDEQKEAVAEAFFKFADTEMWASSNRADSEYERGYYDGFVTLKTYIHELLKKL